MASSAKCVCANLRRAHDRGDTHTPSPSPSPSRQRAIIAPSLTPPTVMLLEKILAALVLLVCVLALVRGALSPRRRQQWDQAAHRTASASRRAGQGMAQGLGQGWRRWRGRRGAADEAQAAIERARRMGRGSTKSGPADGGNNVIRPKAFERKPQRDDKPH